MQPTELVTAMQEGLKITVLLMNNHGFQIIRRLQMGRVGISFGNEFRARDRSVNRLTGDYLKIDFAQNAASMGARTWNVTTPAELQKALHEARQESRSCVIVAEIEPHRYGPSSQGWWDVAAAEVTNDPETQQARTAYEADRYAQQRLHY
jgi:3D-(3,5/4)-trihydroxycyclohexane-1,2-dione acylhydrolase (decyclizing)